MHTEVEAALSQSNVDQVERQYLEVANSAKEGLLQDRAKFDEWFRMLQQQLGMSEYVFQSKPFSHSRCKEDSNLNHLIAINAGSQLS